MQEIKVPGVAWALGIILGIALLHENAARIEALTDGWISVWYIDFLIAAVLGFLKWKFPGTRPLEQALEIINILLNSRRVTTTTPGTTEDRPQMRGPSSRSPQTATTETVVYDPPLIPEVPAPPRKAGNWLFG